MEARVPAKVILAGEHAVVYGRRALAAAINLYTVVQIRVVDRGTALQPPVLVDFRG
jgi:mevalonate kinase